MRLLLRSESMLMLASGERRMRRIQHELRSGCADPGIRIRMEFLMSDWS
jgi:hypothetical protein